MDGRRPDERAVLDGPLTRVGDECVVLMATQAAVRSDQFLEGYDPVTRGVIGADGDDVTGVLETGYAA